MSLHVTPHRIDRTMPGESMPEPLVPYAPSKFTDAEMEMFRHGWTEEDMAPERITGPWRCLVCGSRHSLKRLAIGCCKALRALPARHTGRPAGHG